jgi:nucleoid DNA-binding protein
MAKKAASKAASPKAAPAPAPAPAPAAAPAPTEKPEKPEKAATPRAKGATKGEIHTKISEKTGLSKKDVASVFDALGELITTSLAQKKGPGLFVIPGLLKLKVVSKPATKAKQGINPFTKEPMTFKAKPARKVIKAIPLKALKDSV